MAGDDGDLPTRELTSAGTVVGWGWNYYGQATPPTDLSDVVAIAAGHGYSLTIVDVPIPGGI